MKLRFIVPSLLLVVILVAACSPPPVLRDDKFLKDTSLLTDEPCAAPCWRGITPGETAWRDALIIVEDDAQLTSIEELTDDESSARVLNFSTTDGLQCCRLYTADGETVSAVLTLLAPQMTLEQIIDKFGDPAYLTGGDVTADQTLLSLVYPDTPLVVYVFAAGTAEGELSDTSEIVGVIYPSATDMQDILTSSNLYAWEGYMKVSDLLDGNFEVTAEAPIADTNGE